MTTPEQLSKIIDLAFSGVEQAITAVAEADSVLYFAQAELADTRGRILATHEAKELGANEAQREAKLLELTEEVRKRVRLAEQRKAEERTVLEIARLRKEHALADLRLLELAAPPPAPTPLRLS